MCVLDVLDIDGVNAARNARVSLRYLRSHDHIMDGRRLRLLAIDEELSALHGHATRFI